MTIAEWLRGAAKSLDESGCPDPAIDARWIAEDLLHLTSSALRFQSADSLNAAQLDLLNAALNRRMDGEPVQYILGIADFMGLKFYVDARVLIPRQDTETLAEAVIVALRDCDAPRVLDLCTGSGAIGLSVKTLCPTAEVTLTDVSAGALDVAKRNARLLGVDAVFRHGDLFKAVGHETFDLIASNPPYIVRGELAELQREVRHEPEIALDGGEDGFDFYRRIAKEADAHLLGGGSIYLETGAGQAECVLALLRENIACADFGIINDLNGIGRVAWVRKQA